MVYSVSLTRVHINPAASSWRSETPAEMTFLAATSDSLSDLKARRDGLVRLRAQQAPEQSRDLLVEREAQAAREFVTWFTAQHKDGGISMPTENVMDVQPSLSRRFCIGLHDLRYFVGVP